MQPLGLGNDEHPDVYEKRGIYEEGNHLNPHNFFELEEWNNKNGNSTALSKKIFIRLLLTTNEHEELLTNDILWGE